MVNPKSLENLSPFTPETAPKGRKNAGLSINEWRNVMAEYAKDEIENVLADPRASAAKLIAAKELMQAMEGDRGAKQDVCDYTNHRPLTKGDVTHHDGEPRTESERAAARDSVLARIRGRIQRTA